MGSDFLFTRSVRVPEGWTVKKLIDCTEDHLISYGIVQPGKHVSDGVPILRVNNFKNEQLDLTDILRVSPEVASRYKRTVLKGGEVLLTLVGSTGKSVVAPSELAGWNVPRAIAVIRPQKEIGSNWINICLQSESVKHFLDARANTTVQKTLNLKDVKDLPIILPPKTVRSSIEAVSASLEGKMRLNNQINQTLEQMAQAIFKSWFVDFEPVKVKIAALEAGGTKEDALIAAMQAISGKDKAQLARFKAEQPDQYNELRTTAELFPSAMQDSELGEIPEGWRVLTLSSMIDLIGGGTPKKSEPSFWNGNICWFSVKDVPANSNVFVVDTEEKITEEGLSRSSTKILPVGTTIITARGTVGKLALTGVPTAMNQSCYGVIASDGSGSCLNYLRLSAAVDTLKQNTHGAVFDTITRGTFDSVTQPYPCSELRDSFETAVAPLFGAIKGNLLQSNNLSAIRDLLLPKLLAGDIGIVSSQLEMESS